MKIRELVIGLELHARDAALLQYSKSFSQIFKPLHVRYVNIHEEISLPPRLTSHFPNAKKELSSLYVKEMVEKAEKAYIPKQNVSFEALEDDTLNGLLNLIAQDKVDLLAIGLRERKEDRNLAYRKIIRKSSASILIVPEKAVPRFKQIVVGIDFSEYSKLALFEAIEIASITGGEVICQHVYEVPSSYHKLNKTFLEAASIIKKACVDEFYHFIKNINTKGVRVEPVFTLNEHASNTEAIMSFVKEIKADLMVIGSKGHSTLGSLLLGSTAETILDFDENVPLLLIKEKGKNISFSEEFSNV